MWKKKRREQKKKATWQKEKKAGDVFPNLLDEKQIFQIHHNRQSKNAKTEPFFKTQKKQDKTRKINVKHVQQKKQTTRFFC